VNNQSLVALSQRLDALESQLRDLHGNVEELQNNGETLRKQQRDLYADLDRRISALEAALKSGTIAGPAGGTGLAAGPGAAAGAASADQAAYNHAFEALKAADYGAAIAQFRDFLRLYAHSALADNAQYWLGEATTSRAITMTRSAHLRRSARNIRNRARRPMRCSNSAMRNMSSST